MIKENSILILKEISRVFELSDFSNVSNLIDSIKSAGKIVLIGAGKVGYATKGFCMRLKHLGFDSYFLGDSNVPSISEKDLLIVASGSGETKTIFDLVNIAKENHSKVVLITGNPNSSMGKIADIIIQINAPSKTKQVEEFKSVQPMTTLNEQSLIIFYDSLVLDLMEELGETHESMWERHSNLE